MAAGKSDHLKVVRGRWHKARLRNVQVNDVLGITDIERRREYISGGIRTALTCILDWINPPNRSRIAIDFAQPFRGKQTYMLHCHNLEHEDQGMMVAFTVDD